MNKRPQIDDGCVSLNHTLKHGLCWDSFHLIGSDVSERFVRMLGRALNHHAKVVKRFSIGRKRARPSKGGCRRGWLRGLRLQEGPQVLWIQWFPQRVLHSARRVRCRVWAPVLVGEKAGCFPQGQWRQRTAKGLPPPFLRSLKSSSNDCNSCRVKQRCWVAGLAKPCGCQQTGAGAGRFARQPLFAVVIPLFQRSIQPEGRRQGAVGQRSPVTERPCPACPRPERN